MEDIISRAEHEEFVKRMEGDHKRIDKRLALLEKSVEENKAIALSVRELAQSVKDMCKEQERQGKRLETLENRIGDSNDRLDKRLEELESRDGQKWRQVVSYVTTAIISIILGFLASQFGLT